MAQVLAFFFTEMSDYYTVSWDAVFFFKTRICPKLEKNNLQLHRSSWLFVAAISWYCIFFYDFVAKGTTMNCNANWHFSQKSFWSWLSRSIALYFYFFQCYKAFKNTKKKKKNLHLKCQPEGISRKLFFIIACGSIIVGNDVAQVTPSILYRQAVFIIRRVERRSKAFPHINFQLLVLCWNVLKLLSLGLGGKEKKKICLASRGLVTGSI